MGQAVEGVPAAVILIHPFVVKCEMGKKKGLMADEAIMP